MKTFIAKFLPNVSHFVPVDHFPQLTALIDGCFGYNAFIEAATVPEALAHYAMQMEPEDKAALFRDLARFLKKYRSSAEDEFRSRYWFDFMPEDTGQTLAQFFAMTAAIMADPSLHVRFEHLDDQPS